MGFLKGILVFDRVKFLSEMNNESLSYNVIKIYIIYISHASGTSKESLNISFILIVINAKTRYNVINQLVK